MKDDLASRKGRSAALVLGAAALLGWAGWPRAVASTGEEGSGWLPETVFAPVLGNDRKLGFVLRADTWDGDLPVGETKPIRQQLAKGNDYRFYVSTRVPGAAVSVHIYDQDGNLVEGRSWQKEEHATAFAGADFRPKATGSYYLILKVEKSPEVRTAWAMAYAFK